ncbi:MAG: hypothetical protein E7168_05675 [Firmicutes bacterium]|nr:hypothetical protein [Bacillota bacterium]
MKELNKLREVGNPNPYITLCIKETANEVEIKSAYRNLVKLYGNDQDRKNADNQYLIDIFTACRDVLLNSDSRRILDEELSCVKKQNAVTTYNLKKERQTEQKTASEPRVKPYEFTSFNNQSKMKKRTDLSFLTEPTTAELLVQTKENPLKNKIVRTEMVLPEVMSDYSFSNYNELSFVDLQIILKEFLRRTWATYTCTNSKKDNELYGGKQYFLLDKKGQLDIVYRYSGLSQAEIINANTGTILYSWDTTFRWSFHGSLPEYNDLLQVADSDTAMVPLDTIMPYTDNSGQSIMKAYELCNECLLELKKYGYLKKAKPNQYLR